MAAFDSLLPLAQRPQSCYAERKRKDDMAYYMVTAHNKDGTPLHMAGLMPFEAAHAKAAELWDRGFARISVTNTDTLVEVELAEFHRKKPGA